MRAVDLIRKKRDGKTLTKEEINWLINSYTRAEVPDYQMSAFLMASLLRGLNKEETIALTETMRDSGEVLDLREMADPKIGKHSTGGVGDKVSIVLAPLLASAGVVVPMIAGRGLGHTGGTIDKLESIPGFKTDLSVIDFRNTLWEVGTVISSQTSAIAPADRKLYRLRDVTATVESIPLIASSIMSKKLAEGINGLVLDVKVGSGAFMQTMEEAEELAQLMVDIGNSQGVKTFALITDMDEPLGKTVGNALEIRECINILKGRGEEDILEVILTLGSLMLYIAEEILEETEEVGVFKIKEEPIVKEKLYEKRINLESKINSGDALEKFIEMITAQGGNPEVVPNPGLLTIADKIMPIKAAQDGFINRIDARKIAESSVLLGAGRNKIEDEIDLSVGITLNKKSGSEVKAGDILAVIHYNKEDNLQEAISLVESAFEISSEKPEPREIIKKLIL
ncbi:MAG: thymidine phosphorylase [Nitrospirae bacterium]|nr:thymidine phosphorylase [Nitrospirota bacterium]